jgi:hypothetical protein
MKYTFKYYVIRWLVSFGYLADGIIMVCTLGFCVPTFTLYMEGWFLDYVEEMETEIFIKNNIH